MDERVREQSTTFFKGKLEMGSKFERTSYQYRTHASMLAKRNPNKRKNWEQNLELVDQSLDLPIFQTGQKAVSEIGRGVKIRRTD